VLHDLVSHDTKDFVGLREDFKKDARVVDKESDEYKKSLDKAKRRFKREWELFNTRHSVTTDKQETITEEESKQRIAALKQQRGAIGAPAKVFGEQKDFDPKKFNNAFTHFHKQQEQRQITVVTDAGNSGFASINTDNLYSDLPSYSGQHASYDQAFAAPQGLNRRTG